MITLSTASFLVEAIGPAAMADPDGTAGGMARAGGLARFLPGVLRRLAARGVSAGFGTGRMIGGAV